MVPVVVYGRYNFPGQLLQPKLSKLAFITPCPPSSFQWTGFIAFLTSLDIHSPQQTPHQSRMDFVQQFLSIKPEEMFKTINREPPTTFLFGLIAICGIVLTMTIIFIIGLCNLCRTAPSIKDSEESVTLVETPV